MVNKALSRTRPTGGSDGIARRKPPGLARILITDDRPETFELVGQALGGRYVCEFVPSVDRAREALGADPYDLVLCVFEIPAASDLNRVESIIRDHQDVAVVVVITAQEISEVTAHSPVLNASGYLVKPCRPGQLLITTMNALGHHQQENLNRAYGDVLLASAERRAEKLGDELAFTRQASLKEVTDPANTHEAGRMASIAAFLGEELGLSSELVSLLRRAAPLRDVGNINTPDDIFRKAGALTVMDWRQIEEHPVTGHSMLSRSPGDLPRMAARIALSHHERWDGSGYPEQLAGADIPLESRISAIADSFDALLSDRSHRSALCTDDAIAVIGGERGTHFDPYIVDVFLDHINGVLRC
jgi:putative two-component system response regulator